MQRIVQSKYRHNPGRFLILLCVLTLAMVFFSMGTLLYVQSVTTIQTIEEETTTLAMLQVEHTESSFNTETWMTEVTSFADHHRKLAENLPSVIQKHPGTTFTAVGENLHPVLPSKEQRYLDYSVGWASINMEKLAAFKVRIDEAEISRTVNEEGYYIHTEQGPQTVETPVYTNYTYTMQATVLEDYVRSPQMYPHYGRITIQGNTASREGSPFMEEGKEYIVFGQYADPKPVKLRIKNTLQQPPPSWYEGSYNIPHELWLNWDFFDHLTSYNSANLDLYYYYEHEDGSWSHFETTPSGLPLWLEPDDERVPQMLEWAENTSKQFSVTGVSTLNALPIFAMGEAYLTQGRDIAKKDLTEQNHVCIISQRFAEVNHLTIGDTITADLYQNPMTKLNIDVGQRNHSYRVSRLEVGQQPAAQISYEVAGIYYVPEWIPNKYFFTPNSVFVPESTLPASGETGLSYADTLILQNGSNEQFMQEAEKVGIPEGTFMVYDGGYTQFMTALNVMLKDSRLVLMVCFILFLVLSFGSLSMMACHLRQDAVIMIKVGASPLYARRYMLLCILPIVLISVLLAYAVSCMCYAPMMASIENWYAMQRPAYSNLVTDSTGMLTSHLGAVPSPLGAAFSLILCTVSTLVLVCRGKVS